MSNKEYYGSEEQSSISYLEFGCVDFKDKSKKIWGYWQDQEAYDLYMFARYSKDMFAFRELIEENKTADISSLYDCIKHSAHDKILDYIFKYAGLLSVEEDGAVCESGSSLYGWIDEALAMDSIFHCSKNAGKIKAMSYVASDIAEMMNKGAKVFHPDTKIYTSTAPNISELADDIKVRFGLKLSLFYGLSVSLRYALREARDIIKMCNITDLFISNRLSFSFRDTYTQIYGTGKTVYIISLPELNKLLSENGFYAKYCTVGMQYNKDGDYSVRASVAISKTKEKIDQFIDEYEYCVGLIKDSVPVEKGEWLELSSLKEV